jgi:uncharacterized protein (TIGR02271 family)
MPTIEEISGWIGEELVGADDAKLGTISHVYVDRKTGEPSFVSVKTGMFGMKSSLVPVAEAAQHGDHVHVPFTKDQVKDAPNVEDDEDLSEAEEQRLYEHYSLAYSTGGEDEHDDASAGHDTSGPNTDQAMTRSEEQLSVGKRSIESGRARLLKYVVTEDVSTTIALSHEEATIEREPITDANRDAALRGAEISEEEHEVTLHAEEPVVQKSVVPMERVRLGTETVTEDAEVSDTVRKEQIGIEGDVRGL